MVPDVTRSEGFKLLNSFVTCTCSFMSVDRIDDTMRERTSLYAAREKRLNGFDCNTGRIHFSACICKSSLCFTLLEITYRNPGDYLEKRCGMVIFEDALIVVQNGERRPRLQLVVVAMPGMIDVVAYGSKELSQREGEEEI